MFASWHLSISSSQWTEQFNMQIPVDVGLWLRMPYVMHTLMWFNFCYADSSTEEKSDHSDRNDRRKDRSQSTNKGCLTCDQKSSLHPALPLCSFLSFLIPCLHLSPCFFPVALAIASSGPHRVTDKLFNNTRYFVIKSNNYENVDIAKDRVGSS